MSSYNVLDSYDFSEAKRIEKKIAKYDKKMKMDQAKDDASKQQEIQQRMRQFKNTHLLDDDDETELN